MLRFSLENETIDSMCKILSECRRSHTCRFKHVKFSCYKCIYLSKLARFSGFLIIGLIENLLQN